MKIQYQCKNTASYQKLKIMHVKQKDEKVSSEDSRSMCVKLIGASVNLYSRANVAVSYRSILSIWDKELDQTERQRR